MIIEQAREDLWLVVEVVEEVEEEGGDGRNGGREGWVGRSEAC